MSERSAMNQALFYLGGAARTKKQMREYLLKKEHSEEIIEATLARLLEYGYLNDGEYAEAFVRSRGSTGGRHKLQIALMQKGLDRETAEHAAASVSDEDELRGAAGWIAKWERQFEGLSERERRDKIYRRLASRGYDWEIIKKALDESKPEDFEDD